MANYVSNLTVQVGDNSSATYNIRELFPHVGTCSTAAATAAKEVTIGNFKLYTGAWVVVKFNNTNSAAVASLTLNVDGTGAKPIKYRNANLGGAGDLAANRYTMFIYDGTNYQIVMDFNSNTYDRTSQQTRIYAGTIGVFNYSLCAMDNNQRMQSFTTTSGTGTAKTFNTSASFMYPVVIMYNAANSTYADGTAIANNVLYEQYPSVDLRYSCNVTSTAGFTQYKPVYLECTINSDGTFKLTTTGLTQTFTNGKYYILLGCMYNTSIYQLALFAQHPMFYYDGTHLNGIVYTAAEKTKLSGIANGATKVESSSNGKIKINGTDTTVYTHPSHTSKTSGLYKITVDSLGHVSATAAVAKGDIPALDYSKVSISRSLTSGTKIGSITIDGTSTDLYCQTNTNTDTLVSQTFATADHNRPLLMSYYDTGIETTTAQIVHRNDALYFNPSSGVLRSPRLYLQTTGMPITINLDTLQPAAGENVNVLSVRYKNTDGTATHTVYPIGILGNSATGSGAANNSGVRLGSTNGTTIVGAGESSVTFAAAQAKYNDESLYLVADQAVYMYTNCSNDATTVTGPWRVGGFTTGTAAITSGRVMITDGTTGGFKASDYTIAKSVPSDAKFSDTVTTVTTSGSGNAVTSITASNGALTVTKGSTFSLSTHTHDSLYGVSSTSAVPVTTLANGQLKVFYHVNNDLTGNMPASNNANAIIQINKHPGDYDAQLGFSSNGSIYYRSSNGTALSASVPWRKIYDTSNPPTASEVGALASTTKYAGSSSVGGAATSADKLNTNAGNAQNPVYFSNGIPVACKQTTNKSWYGVPEIRNDGVMEIGRYLDFHSSNTGETDYDVRIDVSDTSQMTLSSNSGKPRFKIKGTEPTLNFAQTTTDKAYDSSYTGIKAYPGDTSGLALVMQSGGMMVIASGESGSNGYPRLISTSTSDTDKKRNPYLASGFTSTAWSGASEVLILSSDNAIYFQTNMPNSDIVPTDWDNLKTICIDTSGNFKPTVNKKGQLGTSSLMWNAIYSNTIYENGTSLANKYAAKSHTHSYLPLAGGTMDDNSTIVIPGVDNARSSTLTCNGAQLKVSTSSNWAMGLTYYNSASTSTSVGFIGAYGTTDAFESIRFGAKYDNWWMKITDTETTIAGDLVFSTVSSTTYPAESKKIKFGGGTDWGRIYYRVDAADAGRFVLDIGDDSNARIDFAYNGTTKSYIDTSGNFSGNAYSATNVHTTVTNGSTSSTNYGIVFAANPNTTEINTLKKTNDFRYQMKDGAANTEGFATIVLGNAKKLSEANNKSGNIFLYSSGGSWHNIITASTTSNITHTLPATSGTILNSGTTSFTQTLSSGTKIGTIKINGTSTDIYCQTNTNTTYSAGNHLTLSDTTFKIADYCKNLNSGDWNTVTTNGWYMGYQCTNAPSAAWWIGHVHAHNNKYCIQELWNFDATPPDTAKPDAMFMGHKMRWFRNSTWGPWVDVSTPTPSAKVDCDWDTVASRTTNVTRGWMAFWNGAYNGTTSNLTYCNKGAFGTIITKNTGDYVPNTQDGVSDAINLLSTGSSNPGLADYYIAQYVNGGTTTKSYHRRPISALWNTFKGLITLETTGSGNAVTGVSIANDGDHNRKITVTKGSTFSLSTHTHNYAGSSSAGGAATSANKINTNAGATNRPVYFSGGVPVQCDTPGSGSWFKGVPLIGTDGVMEIGKYIDFHGSGTSTADYDLRLEYDSTTTGHTITIPPTSATMAVNRKSLITDGSDDFASYAWHKFADVTITGTNYDYFTTFVVSSGFDVSNTYATKKIGLLTMHVRTSSTRIFAAGEFEWLVAGEQIDPNNFVMVYTNTANTSCKVELWYKLSYKWEGFTFNILEEHTRTVKEIYTMKLYDASGHGSASYTTGSGNPIISKLGKIKNAPGIYAVKGTQTASTSVWTGEIDISELYDGLTIAYYLPYASTSTSVTLNLTLSDGTKTGAINCYYNNTSRITSHYGAGSTVILTYWSAGSISVSGTATTDNRWTRCDYNSNSSVTQNIASGSANRPLLMSYYQTGTATTAAQVVYRNDLIYANPSTGAITANKFYGDITGSGLNAGIYDLLNIDDPIFDGAEWMLTSIPSSSGGTSTPSFRRVKTAKFADYVNSVSRDVLFNDSTNTSKSITLSTPPTDTQYLKLYFKSSGNSGQSTMDNSVYSIAEVPYMTDVNLGGILQVAQPSDNMGVLKSTVLAFTIKITNHTLTLTKASYPSRLDGSAVANDTHLSANIIKVVAYR